MLGVGIALVLQINVGALTNLSTNIETGPQSQYDKAVVLEHTLNPSLDNNELDAYTENFENPELLETRSFIPLEFFTEDGDLSYETDGANCYIPRVSGLDGQDFGFFVSQADPDERMPDEISCTSSRLEYRESPVIAVDEDGRKHALKVHIYEIN